MTEKSERSSAQEPKEFLPFNRPWFGPDEIAQVTESLESGWVTRGPKTAQFEAMFREYIGSAVAIGLNSATSGLHLALECLHIGGGDEVITTPMTYCATSNEIEHAGAVPVFVDVDPETYLIDASKIESAVTERTKAILPVHLYGQAADMTAIMDIAKRHNLRVVEDAAHAIETTHGEQKIGTIGDFTVFSFYPTKNISTGEGGMLTTMDEELGEYAMRMSMHGNSKDAWKRYGSSGFAHYSLIERGYKYHMFDLLAAVGIAQFPKLESWWAIRKDLFEHYNELLSGVPGVRPIPVRSPGRHAYHLYVIEVDAEIIGCSRDELMDFLQQHNVGVGIHYYGMHLQPYYINRYGFKPEDFPNATRASERMLSLPLYPRMSRSDVESVVATLRSKIMRN